MLQFFVTLAVGASVGWLFSKLKIPGGMMVGAILGVAILHIGFGAAYMPSQAKAFAQIMAGAFIGSTVSKSDLLHLRHIVKPAALVLSLYLLINLAMGAVIYLISPLDMATAFFSAVPGGISDIPLVAADMGGNPAKVAAMQFVRLVIGVGFFPSMIKWVCTDEECPENTLPTANTPKTKKSAGEFTLTLAVAVAAGAIGVMLGIPAGAIVFSLFGVIALKLLFGKGYLPFWSKRLAQALSGAYIGCSMTLTDLLEMRHLLLPILLIAAGYSLNCFLMGSLLHRLCGMSRKEGMLVATPAGASDMALISLDMGVQSTDLVVLQIIRLVVVTSVFPQIIGLILRAAAG